MPAAVSPKLKAILERLRRASLAYPEAVKDMPWGDWVAKVKKKIFFFCGMHDGALYTTTKLPASGVMALQLPFTEPTGYGLGKAGWVSAKFKPGDEVPEWLLLDWLHESYRAVAPKKLADLVPPRREGSAAADAPAAAAAAAGPARRAKAKAPRRTARPKRARARAGAS
jgi:predicted DNA-binding protein (MmcQ/YjbR family)